MALLACRSGGFGGDPRPSPQRRCAIHVSNAPAPAPSPPVLLPLYMWLCTLALLRPCIRTSVTARAAASFVKSAPARYWLILHSNQSRLYTQKRSDDMTIRATKFTPRVLLEAPRRDAGVPNSDASQILYSVTVNSLQTHTKTREIRLFTASTGESVLVTNDKDISNPTWVTDSLIALLKSKEDGTTELLLAAVESFGKQEPPTFGSFEIPGAAGDLKIRRITGKDYAVAFSAKTNPDGSLYVSSNAPKRHTTARLYSSLFVRHWDTWRSPQYNSIWFTTLTLADGDAVNATVSTNFKNALQGTNLASPIEPFGGADHYDISPTGIVFVAKDPKLNPALHTRCNAYFLATDFKSHGPLLELTTATDKLNLLGAATSPVFSKDGRAIALLKMREDGYEADKNIICVWLGLHTGQVSLLDADKLGSNWSFSPSSVQFSPDGHGLLVTAEQFGVTKIFETSLRGAEPKELALGSTAGSVGSFQLLDTGNLFISTSSFVENSAFYIYDRAAESSSSASRRVSSMSHDSTGLGLNTSQIDSVWSPSVLKNPVTDNKVHSWIVKPTYFDPKKKYPVALLIHGGPQGAWTNSWSTRWNPAVFAEQGYVVVMPNPTGSTGYGQAFTDGIKSNWGGSPYEEIVGAFDYVIEHLEYVDKDRAVAAGASYGGYMVNWIQGHPLGRRLKALVTHDGLFALAGELATDELYFVNRDLGGSWIDPKNREAWKKWDPAQFVQNWATPHLVIHSEKDYRLTMADGLGAFNALQMKGVESEFLTFEDENHWVLKPENSLVWHQAVLTWLNKYVGLPAYEADELDESRQDPPRNEQVQLSDLKISR